MESKKIITKRESIKEGLNKYFTDKECIHGHIDYRYTSSGHCCSCIKIKAERNKEKRAKYYLENKEKIIDQTKKSKIIRSDHFKEYSRKYYINNREHLLNASKENSKKNIGKTRIRVNNRLKEDHLYKLKKNIRSLVSLSFRNNGYTKKSKTYGILCCSFEFLKEHIEKQFKQGMSWNNRSEWHIDHKIPIATAKTEEEIIKLNHYTNLQPLWAIDNLKKGAKLNYVIS